MKKRILSILISVAMVFSMFPTAAFAGADADITTAAQLQQLITNSTEATMITLTHDIVCDAVTPSIILEADKNITLDLGGHSITGCAYTSDGYTYPAEAIIVYGGNLTLTGTGTLIGSSDVEKSGDGLSIYDAGTVSVKSAVTFKGGSASGDKAYAGVGIRVTDSNITITGDATVIGGTSLGANGRSGDGMLIYGTGSATLSAGNFSSGSDLSGNSIYFGEHKLSEILTSGYHFEDTATSTPLTAEAIALSYCLEPIKVVVDKAQEQVKALTFSPIAGTYTETQTVAISTLTEGADIYYTIDGTEPTVDSTKYTTPITVGATATIKAIAAKSGMTNSEVASAAYTIDIPSTYAISATPTSATFGSANVGYAAQDAQTITVSNTGNQTVTLTQPTSTNYTIGELSKVAIAPLETATFTVAPKAELAVGNYAETITVNGTENTTATVAVDFTVTEVITYTATVTNGTGSAQYEANAVVSIEANAPETGKVFDMWTTTDDVVFAEATAPSTTFTMPAKDVTVTATYKDITIDDATQLQQLIRDSNGPTTIVLTNDIVCNEYATSITIEEDKDITLDLNGHNLSGYTYPDGYATSALTLYGKLNITGTGSLTGANSNARSGGAGLYIYSGTATISSAVTITGGNTSGAESSAGNGIGVGNGKVIITGDVVVTGGNSTGTDGYGGQGIMLWNESSVALSAGTYTGGSGTSQGSALYLGKQILSDAVASGCYFQKIATQELTTAEENATYQMNEAVRVVSEAKAPTFSPEGGNFEAVQTVAISTLTEGATIYYTTNAKAKPADYIKYTAPIAVNTTTTVKAFAKKEGMLNSPVATATYTITLPVYSISAVPTSVLFDTVKIDYPTPEAKTITINNTGNKSITLTQPTSTNYTIGELSKTVIAAGETATFTVAPKSGLKLGVYDETITVNGTNNTTATVDVKFLVAEIITFAAKVENGTGSGEYEENTVISITATPAVEDTVFVKWVTKDNVVFADANATTTTFTMPAHSVTITATYKSIPADTSSIDAALTNADVAKKGMYVSDNKASSISKGTKFVTPAEMQLLTDAIAAAIKAKDTVITSVQAREAASLLNNAVTVFNASIKVGTASSGGGGSSNTGNAVNNSSATIVKSDDSDAPTTAQTNVSATVDKNGTANVTIPEKNVDDAVKLAQEEAKKNGTEKNGISVTINVTTKQTATSLEATLSKESIAQLIESGVTEVKIQSDGVNITLDLEALKQIQDTLGSDVTIKATKADITKLSKDAQAAIGNRPVFNLSITGNDKTVSSFGNGSASISIPYTLGENEDADNICAAYIDDEGNVTYIENSVYDAKTKTLTFSTDHFSVYGVACKTDFVTFSDIKTHWAKTDIEFVATRKLLSGIGNDVFSPNTSMTRGMFVTALGRLAAADISNYTNSHFSDVTSDAYYMGYVEWAAEKGIVNGTSTTTFAPDKAITREEMAVIMANYAKIMGATVPKTNEAVEFADGTTISTWAAEAVEAMQQAGIITGKDGNNFDPDGTATRAEVSTVLHRYIELVIDKATI